MKYSLIIPPALTVVVEVQSDAGTGDACSVDVRLRHGAGGYRLRYGSARRVGLRATLVSWAREGREVVRSLPLL